MSCEISVGMYLRWGPIGSDELRDSRAPVGGESQVSQEQGETGAAAAAAASCLASRGIECR